MTDFEHILLDGGRLDTNESARPIYTIARAGLEAGLARLGKSERAWAEAHGFAAQPGRTVVLPDRGGGVAGVVFGLGDAGRQSDPFLAGKLASELPDGLYTFAGDPPANPRLAALGWLLESYRFDRYRSTNGSPARLVSPAGVERSEVLRVAEAVALVRDLINTPAGDLGPGELEAAAGDLAARHGAAFQVTSGKELAEGFPLIHAVGAASSRAPRLIDLTWGPVDAPKVSIVGKGVCFDTGGLDIKSSSNMALMKKDMGGAANVLGLAALIMEAGLAVRLRVLIPAVDNVISGNAFRPGDVLRSRKGLTVEIGNTDAEGRLVLADALTLADEEAPDLIIDLATLTGAARAALGPDLPAFYTDEADLAGAIERHGRDQNDPVWRLPLWERYNCLFESKIADLNNAGNSGFAGSITAALFLKRFVERSKCYAHFDIYAWTPAARPGHPYGGEAQAIRALYGLIQERYRN
jgi:leucyl aminopeptidase